ncbi:MAG: hypothetical protein F6J90_29035 [Moorea sp. SIOASIH]|uniref:hypothetical protein n=1 Tax=Moorena sp. SIOASIH TaxID=2607817 RepID=UPI0013B99FE3|nr:hypothetical protein [Moorena sp. SIOASIH]NEO40170.1 hypothetical protein [Moorena sp. SIOASIH]
MLKKPTAPVRSLTASADIQLTVLVTVLVNLSTFIGLLSDGEQSTVNIQQLTINPKFHYALTYVLS